jgi:DNA-binding transcriptional MerR regulator
VERYLTTAEVAERFRTVPASVRYWTHVGYGPKSIKVGRKRLYPVEEVERFEADLRHDQNGAPAA